MENLQYNVSVSTENRRSAEPWHATKKNMRSTKFAGDTDQGCEYEDRNAFATSKIRNKCGKKPDGLSTSSITR
jgi:hypothetical protein